MKNTYEKQIFNICFGGIIAAIYVALTLSVGAFNLASGAVQIRISEALCVLPLFTPAAIPGLAIGCLLSNIIMGGIWQDIVFGTLATLIGAVGTYLLGKAAEKGFGFCRWIWFLPPILSNTLIIPLVLYYGYADKTNSLPLLFVFIAAGEIISVGIIGSALIPMFNRIFRKGTFR